MSADWPLLSLDAARSLDHRAQQSGVPASELMERAGGAVWLAIKRELGARLIVVVAGKGNNGGDALVVARLAAAENCIVSVKLVGIDPSAMTGEPARQLALLRSDMKPSARSNPDDLDELLKSFKPGEPAAIVDGLLGIGAQGPPYGDVARAIASINAASARGVPVVSIDVPSGVPADPVFTGPLDSVQATITVTIGAPKLGLATGLGAAKSDRVLVAESVFPAKAMAETKTPGNWLRAESIRARLPARPLDGHKGSFGRAFLVGGSVGLGGAAILAGQGLLRSGVGLTHIAVPEALYAPSLASIPEAIVRPIPRESTTNRPARMFEPSHVDGLVQEMLHARASVLGIGPGLGATPATTEFLRGLLKAIDTPPMLSDLGDEAGAAAWTLAQAPLLLDADAIAVLAVMPRLAVERRGPVGITPHPGELAKLLETTPAKVQQDRLTTALAAAARFGVWVLLKGAQTILASPQGGFWINPSGNSGLAKGGSGDVLLGLATGLAAQGMTLADAMATAAYVHGLSADLLVQGAGADPRSILPSEVAANLGAAFRALTSPPRPVNRP